MSELRGPADADGFRVKVGRYGDRWYHNPLPGDHIAPASEWIGPAVTTCKKASGNDWSFVALKRVADALETDKYRNLAHWPHADRYEALKAINKIGLTAAGQRGTNVHLMFEAGLHGRRAIVAPDAPGEEYRAAVDQFFDQYQPTLYAAEFVCIHHTLNGVGYGGTADAIITIDDKKFLVDWKSRGIDSDHGAHPEEAAQVGALAGADYIIVEGDNGPERRLMPTIDGGLIVSIKPDGCRVYPIDLNKSFTHWTALHAWWVARRDERDPIGRQWPARKNSPAVPSVAAVTADGARSAVPTPPSAPSDDFNETLAEANQEGEWLDDFDAPMVRPLTIVDAKARLAEHPDQGADLSSEADYGPLWAAVKADYERLDVVSRAWVAELSSRATQRGLSFHTLNVRTERSYHIAKGLVALCAGGNADDDILRALLAPIVGDVALFPGVPTGHVLGSLDAAQATRFGVLVDQFISVTPAA